MSTCSLLKFSATLVLIAWVLIVVSRIAGPSNLCDKEQPRTVSYTADMVLHHQWILPQDTFAIPATKPPLYNWLSAPFVEVFGFHEWTLRMPSILASLAVISCIVLFGRRIDSGWAPTTGAASSLATGIELGLIAALLWLANLMTNRLVYLARPDMLLTAFLCGAWFAATLLATTAAPRRSTALAYWLCTTGAAFTKGPMVLLALFYLPLAAAVLPVDWSCIRRSAPWWGLPQAFRESSQSLIRVLKRAGWWWGVPLFAGLCLAWAALAWRQDPEFFRAVFLGREMKGRAATTHEFFKTFFNGPLYMISWFLPWSPCVVLMLCLIPLRRWFKHPLAPAILWMLLIFVVYSFARTKRADRYAPVFPAEALIAAYFLIEAPRRLRGGYARLMPAAVALTAGTVVLGLVAYNLAYDPHGYGRHLTQFVRAVQQHAGRDPILFLDGEQTPLQTLLGRHQAGPPTLDFQRTAPWCIRFLEPAAEAVVVSKSIPQIDGAGPGSLALYRLKPGEGVAAYQQSLKVPLVPADDALSDEPAPSSGAGPSVPRWVQFWRIHTPPSGPAATQAASHPAAANTPPRH